MDSDWPCLDRRNITASVGVAHTGLGPGVVEMMRSAEAAMNRVAENGGDAVRIGEPIAQTPQNVVV